jgi:poly-gamma-glutamate capsule biosynthesis protein CapA/YwtB (metallophosphatase superfamily)
LPANPIGRLWAVCALFGQHNGPTAHSAENADVAARRRTLSCRLEQQISDSPTRRLMPPRDVLRRGRLAALTALAVLLLALWGLSAATSTGGSRGVQAVVDRGRSDAQRESSVEARPTRLTVAASGDLLIHGPVFERARSLAEGRGYDFRPMFRYVKATIAGADLGICHLETPLTRGQPVGYPLFAAPADLAPAIKDTGWDVCTTASNHMLDRGQKGIDETIRLLNRTGVEHTGSFRSQAERDRTTMLGGKGVKVALLAYTETTNGVPLPNRYSLNRAHTATILADARAARRRGAQVVIVSLHWGSEYQHRPTARQRKTADALTSSPDVTAVIGQHAHVVQPIRRVNGKPVVFGEGNLVSNQSEACCPAASQDGLIALLDLAVDRRGARVESVRHIPTYVAPPDYTVLPVRKAIEAGWADRSALRESLRRTRSVVGSEGEADAR